MGVVLIAALPPTHARVGGIVGGNPTAHVPPTSRTCGLDNRKYLEFCSFASPWRVSAHRSAALEPLSGRQDLNLRPPGPQSEGSRCVQAYRAISRAIWLVRTGPISSNSNPRVAPRRVTSPPSRLQRRTTGAALGHPCLRRREERALLSTELSNVAFDTLLACVCESIHDRPAIVRDGQTSSGGDPTVLLNLGACPALRDVHEAFTSRAGPHAADPAGPPPRQEFSALDFRATRRGLTTHSRSGGAANADSSPACGARASNFARPPPARRDVWYTRREGNIPRGRG